MLLKDGLPRRSFLYAPTDDISTWSLPYLNADGQPDAGVLPGVVASLGESAIPGEFMPMVREKLRQAYRRLGVADLPSSLMDDAASPPAPSSGGRMAETGASPDGEALLAAVEEAGRRNSMSDQSMLQQVHDLTTRLGACCETSDDAAAPLKAMGKGDMAEATFHVEPSGANAEHVTIFESGYVAAEGPAAFVTLSEAGAEFNDESREVWITPIKPGWGNPKDKFFYPPETLKAATEAGVFNGRKMFANHPRKSDDAERPERDVRDWVASVKETFWDPQRGRPRAKVKVYDQAVYDRWKDAPEEIAFSILGGGIARKGQVDGKDARIVESLERIRSVDWVTEAGAGGSIDFAESAHEELDVELKDLTLEQLKDARPDLFAAIAPEEAKEPEKPKAEEKVVEEAAPEAPAPEATVSRTEFDALKAELAAERAAKATSDNKTETAKVVESLVRESALPAVSKRMVMEHFAEATAGEGFVFPDEDALKAAVAKDIDSQRALVDELSGKKSLVTGVGATAAVSESGSVSAKDRIEARIAERFAEDMPTEGATTADGSPVKVSEASKTVAERMAEKV